MWSGAYLLLAVTLLLGSEPPATLRVIASPFLLASLADLDSFLLGLQLDQASTFEGPLHIHGLFCCGVLLVAARVVRILALLCARPGLAWLTEMLVAWPLYISHGLLIHLALHQLAEWMDCGPLEALGWTVLSFLLLLLEYRILLRLDPIWGSLYRRVVCACSAATAVSVAWLVALCASESVQRTAISWWVNNLGIPILYLAPVLWILHCSTVVPEADDQPLAGDALVLEICAVQATGTTDVSEPTTNDDTKPTTKVEPKDPELTMGAEHLAL